MKPPREMFVTGFALWLCLDLDLCNISQDTATCLSGITATVYSETKIFQSTLLWVIN